MLIYTGLTALYKKGHIDFNPPKIYVSCLHSGLMNSNIIKKKLASENVNIDYETNISFGKYREKWNDDNVQYIYSDERLLVEINKWNLNSQMKSKAIKSLLSNIINEKLVQVMHGLRKRRGLNYIEEILYIKKEYDNPISVIKNSKDVKEALKSYLLKIFENENIFTIVKGGTVTQLFWPQHRETIDIDAHFERDVIEKLISKISNKKRLIRFAIHNFDKDIIGNLMTKTSICKKQIAKLAFIPITYYGHSFAQHEYVKLTINLQITGLSDIVKEYKIQKREYGIFHSKIFSFSKELLLAEKFHSIITKPENTKRTKDLLDIYFILMSDAKVDTSQLQKWFYKKSHSGKNSLSREDAERLIKNNLDKELMKIKDDWDNSIKLYDIDNISYEYALSLYKKLGRTLLIKKNIPTKY